MASKTSRKERKYNDLGLGSKASAGRTRALNKDGTFNIRKTNVPFFERINFFHTLVTMSWPRFLLVILLGYLVVNTFFATIYMIVGVEHLTGVLGESNTDKFLEAFFFSAQTITTLGYGRVAPIGRIANVVAAVESMLGLLSFALATGMLYGRFSKPSAKIKYSTKAVVAPYHDINGLMFRVINPQQNQLMEVEATVSLSFQRPNSNLRDFFLLDLERSKVVFFPSVWTIVHPISESSPFHGLTEKDVLEKDAEIIITLKAFDESFSQVVYSRSSFKASEIEWGQKFAYIIEQEKDGAVIDVSRLDESNPMPLN